MSQWGLLLMMEEGDELDNDVSKIFVAKKTKRSRTAAMPDAVKATCVHANRAAHCRGMCKSCYNKWLMERDPEYRERQLKNCREWHIKNPERARANQLAWSKRLDKDYKRRRQLKNYGMSLEDYNDMLQRQNGVCAICDKPPKESKNLQVDHDHNTGIVRGLLCFRCNYGMSFFSENPDRMEKAVNYLRKSKVVNNG